MHKSFDSLQALVREHLELDAFAGHLFVFSSRRKDRVKILCWDRDGFAVWSKRLEEGTYAVPFSDDGAERQREITAQELGALLSGTDLSTASGESGMGPRAYKTFLAHIILTWKRSCFRIIYMHGRHLSEEFAATRRDAAQDCRGSGRTTGSFAGRAEQVSESIARAAGSAAQPQK